MAEPQVTHMGPAFPVERSAWGRRVTGGMCMGSGEGEDMRPWWGHLSGAAGAWLGCCSSAVPSSETGNGRAGPVGETDWQASSAPPSEVGA